jgi:hypothetical protein
VWNTPFALAALINIAGNFKKKRFRVAVENKNGTIIYV